MSEPNILSAEKVVAPHDFDTEVLSRAATPLSVRSFGMTDRGRVRRTNEDHLLTATLHKALEVHQTSLPLPDCHHGSDRSHLFIVADGMGGGLGGERASALAIQTVESFVLDTFKWFRELRGSQEDQVLVDFQKALGQANAQVLTEAAQDPGLHNMGTTLTLAYSQNDVLFVAHAGDSRCYLHRDGALYQLTHDHTLVEAMVRRGILSAAEAAGHKWRHVISNAVGGGQQEIRVEVHKLRLEAGDRILLCTDGLTEMVPEEEIALVLSEGHDPETACRSLVRRANEKGGRDNITVITAWYEAGASS